MPFHVLSELIYYPKVYFGYNSVAKIDPKQGKPNKVDTIDDILAVIYANFLDIATPPGILSHYVAKDYSFIVVKRATPIRIKLKSKIILELIDRIPMPPNLKSLLKDFVNDLTELAIRKRYNEIIALLEKLARETDTLDLYLYVKRKILSLKRKPYVWLENLNLNDND